MLAKSSGFNPLLEPQVLFGFQMEANKLLTWHSLIRWRPIVFHDEPLGRLAVLNSPVELGIFRGVQDLLKPRAGSKAHLDQVLTC